MQNKRQLAKDKTQCKPLNAYLVSFVLRFVRQP